MIINIQGNANSQQTGQFRQGPQASPNFMNKERQGGGPLSFGGNNGASGFGGCGVQGGAGMMQAMMGMMQLMMQMMQQLFSGNNGGQSGGQGGMPGIPSFPGQGGEQPGGAQPGGGTGGGTGGTGSVGKPPSGSGSAADNIDIRGNKGDGYHYTAKDGVETFRIGASDGVAGEALDPRVEGQFHSQRFSDGENKTFSGRFRVDSGDATTIAQLLNNNKAEADTNKPSAFIVYKDGALYQGHKGDADGQKLADIAPGQAFDLELRSNGSNTDIYVDGVKAGSAEGRSGGQNYFRYGAYHHGDGEAVIHASGVKVS